MYCVSNIKKNNPILYISDRKLGAKKCYCNNFYPCMASTQTIYKNTPNQIINADCKNNFYLNTDSKANTCNEVLVCAGENVNPEWYTKDHLDFFCNLINQRYVPSAVKTSSIPTFTQTEFVKATITTAPKSSAVFFQCKKYDQESDIPQIALPGILEKINEYKNNDSIKNCMSDFDQVKVNTTYNYNINLEQLSLIILCIGAFTFIVAIICICLFLECLKQIICCYCCC